MAELEAAKGGVSTWVKTSIGALGGIFSGVLIMNLTAYVNNAVKPPRPVANFRTVPEGLTVHFQNLSQGGQGWWDFGDGTPLEPATPDHEFITHTYPRAGDYTVKLSLSNVLNDQADRSVPLHLEAGAMATSATAPQIQSLEVTPLSPGSYAPATFRLVSKMSNVKVCVWDLGDDKPLEILTDPGKTQDRVVTFSKPGGYVIKLAAVNGTQYDEKTEIVSVMEPPCGCATAVLTMSGTAMKVESVPRTYTFSGQFPMELPDNVFQLNAISPVRPDGFVIADVTVKGADGRELSMGTATEMALDATALGLRDARNLRLELAPDRQTLRLTGELVRDPARKGEVCCMGLPVVLTEQRRSKIELPPQQVMGVLAMPTKVGSTSLALPLPPTDKTLENVQRHLQLQIRDGAQVAWQGDPQPGGAWVTLQKNSYVASIIPLADQVRVDLMLAP